MNPTSITHIITGLNVGGAERALFTLLTNGLEGPFQNQVISLMGPGHYGSLLEKAGIPLACLNMRQGVPGPAGLQKLYKTMKLHKPNIVQGWMYHGNIAAWLAKMMAPQHPKLCWNVRTSLDSVEDMARSTRIVLLAGRVLSNRANQIIYNSNRSLKQHNEYGYSNNNSLVIPNGFDLSRWRKDDNIKAIARQRLGIKESIKVLGYVGRNDRMKDPCNLFAALQELLANNLDVQAVIVGRDLEKVAPEFPKGRVHFLGQQDDIPNIMPAFDLFCLSSRTEGFPNVLGEAMACGVPCVTTDVGDAAAIVGDTGWVVPKCDSKALAKSLIHALGQSEGYLKEKGRKARSHIEKLYAVDMIVNQYKNTYLGILNNDKAEY